MSTNVVAQGVSGLRQLRAQSAAPTSPSTKHLMAPPPAVGEGRVPRPKSGRLRKKIDTTYMYFQQQVDPIVETLVATFLFKQPIEVQKALLLYFEGLKVGADPIEALSNVNCHVPKNNPKIYFSASLGPILAKLIDAVANERPVEVVDFLLVQLQNADSLDHKRTPIEIKDPFVPQPPVEIQSVSRTAVATGEIVDPKVDAMRMNPTTPAFVRDVSSSETKAAEPVATAPVISVKPDVVPDLKHIQVAMLGISGAGKSSIVNSLVGKFDFKIKPSIGFKPVSLMLGETTNVRFYDLGGGKKIRDIWGDYFHDVHAVIYVVDASAGEDHLAESLDVFQHTATHKYLAGKPLLLLANKQDVEGARSAEVLSEIFGMKRFVHATVRESSSFVKIGGESETKESSPEEEEDAAPEFSVDPRFEASLEWLLSIIQENYPDLNERVEADTVLKKKEEAKKRIERERKVLKNKIAAAFRDQIDPSIIPADLAAPLPDDIFLPDEAANFLSGEIGVEAESLEPIALEILALAGYQRLAMQIIGALKAPISKKKVPMTWNEIHTLVSDLRAELGLSKHAN